MQKKMLFLLVLFISSYTSFSQQLKSPDEFLGYSLGTKYTPHYKIIEMESAAVQIANADWGFKLKKGEEEEKKDDKKDDKNIYANLKRFENREREGITDFTPGSIYKVQLDDSHPLAFGYPDYYFTLKQNRVLYDFMKDGWNVGIIKKENQVVGFVDSELKEKIKDGTVIGIGEIGRGSVIYFADDPILRSF